MKKILKYFVFAVVTGGLAIPAILYYMAASSYRTVTENGREYIIIRCRK